MPFHEKKLYTGYFMNYSSEYAGLPASNSVSAKRLPYNLGVFITETVLDKLGADATETVLNFNIL